MNKRRGRPPTGRAQTAAERMRAYRRRLLAQGMTGRLSVVTDPLLKRVRFSAESLLTPAEQDVMRRFCAGLRRLPRLPRQVAVFGSRARGGSGVDSDLDVAVFIEAAGNGTRDAQLERALATMALRAQSPYQDDGIGIHLRPVVIADDERERAFARTLRGEMDVVWTRPR